MFWEKGQKGTSYEISSRKKIAFFKEFMKNIYVNIFCGRDHDH